MIKIPFESLDIKHMLDYNSKIVGVRICIFFTLVLV